MFQMTKANIYSLGNRSSSESENGRSSSRISNSEFTKSPVDRTLNANMSAISNNNFPDKSQRCSASGVSSPDGARKYGPEDFAFLEDEMFEDDESLDDDLHS